MLNNKSERERELESKLRAGRGNGSHHSHRSNDKAKNGPLISGLKNHYQASKLRFQLCTSPREPKAAAVAAFPIH